MDIQKLRREHPKLLEYYNDNQYSRTSVRYIKKMLKLLFDNESKYNSYEEFFVKFVSTDGIRSTNRHHASDRAALRAIYAFDEFGTYPNHSRGVMLEKVDKYLLLLPIFQQVITYYREYAAQAGKRPRTIDDEANRCTYFLFEMQTVGANTLSDINATRIRRFFFDGTRIIRGASCKQKISAVFQGNVGRTTWNECKRITEELPPLRKAHRNYPYLTEEEARQLLDGLESSDQITLRDKAILKLLYYTGIRGVDISKLKFSDIDWRAERISLVQSKTGVPLLLPLRASVGNAIFDYVKLERPKTKGVNTIFVTKCAPVRSLAEETIGSIVSRALAKIGIRAEGGQKGVRLFRHNLASKLLENDVPTKVISDILGHLSPLSLNPYIDADIKHLRECGLSIASIPVRKEVFEIWQP